MWKSQGLCRTCTLLVRRLTRKSVAVNLPVRNRRRASRGAFSSAHPTVLVRCHTSPHREVIHSTNTGCPFGTAYWRATLFPMEWLASWKSYRPFRQWLPNSVVLETQRVLLRGLTEEGKLTDDKVLGSRLERSAGEGSVGCGEVKIPGSAVMSAVWREQAGTWSEQLESVGERLANPDLRELSSGRCDWWCVAFHSREKERSLRIHTKPPSWRSLYTEAKPRSSAGAEAQGQPMCSELLTIEVFLLQPASLVVNAELWHGKIIW